MILPSHFNAIPNREEKDQGCLIGSRKRLELADYERGLGQKMWINLLLCCWRRKKKLKDEVTFLLLRFIYSKWS
ncbi:hypothetical protein K1719_028901 [Acacia pycnantha]|nr:hypothetical protein K1719_028901 [Acacia pycnantha]